MSSSCRRERRLSSNAVVRPLVADFDDGHALALAGEESQFGDALAHAVTDDRSAFTGSNERRDLSLEPVRLA